MPESISPLMVYHFNGSYPREDQGRFILAQEEDLQRICRFFSVAADSYHITQNIFDSREGKQRSDPNHSIGRAGARTFEMALYRYWAPGDDPHFPHELTHLVVHKLVPTYPWTVELDTADGGKITQTAPMDSTSFMQEGLAIAVDDIVFGRQLLENGVQKFPDDWCRQQANLLPTSLASCVNMDGFVSLENQIGVPFAASLSRYVLRTYGLKKYLEVYGALKETVSPEENVKVIEEGLGISEGELLKSWRASIGI